MRRATSVAVAILLGAGTLTLGVGSAAAGGGPAIDSSPSNATTATTLEWTFSNASPASCELTEGATTVSALADCTSPADYDVSADPGGSYTFTVYASDAADVDVGTTPSATSTVDVAPVSPTITASPTSPDNDTTPSWSFSLPTGATASCELDDPSGDAVDTAAHCTSPYTSPDLNNAPADGTNGQYTFSVTPTAGGVTGAAATSTYTLDTVQPAAPDVNADASIGYSRHPGFTVTGIVSGATLTCTVTGPSGGPAVSVESCGASSELDLSGGDDGTYTLHVTQTKDGNVSSEGTATYQLDTHIPAAPVVTAPTSPGTDDSPTFTVSGIEPGGTAECQVSGPSTVPTPVCGASTTLDLSAAAEGTYTLTVVVKDAAGLQSVPASATYEFEAGGPSVPVVTAPASPSNSRAPDFTVTDSDPVGLTYECDVSGPSPVTTSECGPSTVIDLAGAADGTYQLSVVAIDGLGQAGPAGLASYTLDTTPPPAPVVTGPASPSNDTSPSFTISDTEPGVTLSCSLNGPISYPIPPSQCQSGLTLNLAGPGHDGDYTLSVTATDEAGNSSPAGSADYTLDTTPPPAPTVVAPPSPSNDKSPTFTISDAESDATLSCVLVDPSDATVFDGVCPADGTFDTSSDSLDGQYQLTVTATDPAGNTSSASATWTRDTTPPPAPTVSAPPSPSNDLTPSFVVSDSESGVSFDCTLAGPGNSTVFTGTCPAGDGFDLSGFGDGTYTLSVTATDAAGNTSTPGTASYVLDTTAPPVPTVSLLAPVLS
ncbi:MAG TPA: Ig-like domain-containing protein, partial [Mycobacteriales bacterium]|nr:Ig-like domain-containing protein [Mycobacteriales bacterium]